ncbi:DNA/RNA nuclease SfsA [Kushneria aurantia]|uniref:Sugar fermentation stimulation protein homolog n=1 Tax=Kushneria aurantia TaxID=504092 RepID=A0ABV6G686_9GAMM|nr:DNA/RNA nuclease SfsA [Kushneria aurantia]
MLLPPLYCGVLLSRYKRFLADIRLDDGRVITAHCPNTGSMRAVNVPGCRVWVSFHDSPKRRLAWTWELIELPGGALASVHTGRTNAIAEEALRAGRVMALSADARIDREVRCGEARLDFRIDDTHAVPLWLEVKQVTLQEDDGSGYFPDSVSARGRRHLEALTALVEGGERAMLLFIVAHTQIERVLPATHLDPGWAAAFERARTAGVEVRALGCRIDAGHIVAERRLVVG